MTPIRLFAALSLVLIVSVPGTALAFDDRTTNRAIAAGNDKLRGCGAIREKNAKIDCVAKSLEAVSRNINHRGPGYQYIKRTMRRTASSARSSGSKKKARAVLNTASKTLRTAYQRPVYAGPKPLAKKHFARFAQFVKKARSVLRS